jgi:hypothetical protein
LTNAKARERARPPKRRDRITLARGMAAAPRDVRERRVESELGRLILQVGGVIVMTVAIGLLVPLANDGDDQPRVEDDRPDRVFP